MSDFSWEKSLFTKLETKHVCRHVYPFQSHQFSLGNCTKNQWILMEKLGNGFILAISQVF